MAEDITVGGKGDGKLSSHNENKKNTQQHTQVIDIKKIQDLQKELTIFRRRIFKIIPIFRNIYLRRDDFWVFDFYDDDDYGKLKKGFPFFVSQLKTVSRPIEGTPEYNYHLIKKQLEESKCINDRERKCKKELKECISLGFQKTPTSTYDDYIAWLGKKIAEISEQTPQSGKSNYHLFLNDSAPLFEIKDVMLKKKIDDKTLYYIFTDTFGKTYSVEMNDFAKKGIYAESFQIGSPVFAFDETQTVYSENYKKNKALEKINNGGIKIDENGVMHIADIPQKQDTATQEIVQKIWNMQIGEKTLKALFEGADRPHAIQRVQNAISSLENIPEIADTPGVLDVLKTEVYKKHIDIQCRELLNDIENLQKECDALEGNMTPIKKLMQCVTFKNSIQNIVQRRAQLPIINPEIDTKIATLRDTMDAKILSLSIQHTPEIEDEIKNNIVLLGEILHTHIQSLPQVSQIYNHQKWKDTQGLLNMLEDEKKSRYEDQMNTLISERTHSLQTHLEQQKMKEQKILEKAIKECERLIGECEKIMIAIEEENTVENIKIHDPLVLKIKEHLSKLPKAEAEKLSFTLDQIFTDRKLQIKLKQLNTTGVIHSLDEYGIDTGLYYTEKKQKQIGFKLGGERMASGKMKLKLEYEDGTLFDIDTYLQNPTKFSGAMIFDDVACEMTQMDFVKFQKNLADWQIKGRKSLETLLLRIKETKDETTQKEINKQIIDLKERYKQARSVELFANTLSEKLNLNPRSRLEKPNSKFIVLEEEKELLTKMSAGFSIQKIQQKGIDILEGPPGLGKTAIVKFFAANTNREIVRIQCSKMDPSELFFSPQLKAGETIKQPAEWIQLMQKPGTVILFDEIDKLNPESFEKLHSLFDDARSVYDPQMGMVRANKDCLFVGTRNSYEKISNPIASRAVIHLVKAPSELNEAYKMAKYTGIEYFEKIKYEDFKKIWENKENGKNDKSSKEIYTQLENIKTLIGIFSDLRRAQSNDDYDKKFYYELSYRDAEQIFLRFTQSKQAFKEVILDILVPKARAVVYESDEKDNQEKIVREVVGE